MGDVTDSCLYVKQWCGNIVKLLTDNQLLRQQSLLLKGTFILNVLSESLQLLWISHDL